MILEIKFQFFIFYVYERGNLVYESEKGRTSGRSLQHETFEYPPGCASYAIILRHSIVKSTVSFLCNTKSMLLSYSMCRDRNFGLWCSTVLDQPLRVGPFV